MKQTNSGERPRTFNYSDADWQRLMRITGRLRITAKQAIHEGIKLWMAEQRKQRLDGQTTK